MGVEGAGVKLAKDGMKGGLGEDGVRPGRRDCSIFVGEVEEPLHDVFDVIWHLCLLWGNLICWILGVGG